MPKVNTNKELQHLLLWSVCQSLDLQYNIIGGATSNLSWLAHVSVRDTTGSRWYTQLVSSGVFTARILANPCHSEAWRDKWFGESRRTGYMERAFDRSLAIDGKAAKPLQSGREGAGEMSTKTPLFSRPPASCQRVLSIKPSLHNLCRSAPVSWGADWRVDLDGQ